MEAGKAILLVAQKSAAKDERLTRILQDRLRIQHPADAEIARRHREGIGRGDAASPYRGVEDQRTHYVATADPLPPDASDNTEVEAMRRALGGAFRPAGCRFRSRIAAVLQPLLTSKHFQHFLLLLELERQMRGYGYPRASRLLLPASESQDFREFSVRHWSNAPPAPAASPRPRCCPWRPGQRIGLAT